jgi:hypothetical protein
MDGPPGALRLLIVDAAGSRTALGQSVRSMRKLKTCGGSGLLGSPGFEAQGTLTRGVGPLLRFSRWGRWCEGQAGGSEAAVDQVWPELDPA